ncbi:MAG TPA: NAD(P)-dependent oxidoreductase [Solirubrobacteraceae bacterium]|jgi:nucleoside-diphosphate-sugar epimerase|nr:NAD(P)-dependent oxidoreductase [Solirubrobacteraceae bacterium]
MILVTGGSGYIGAAVVHELLSAGEEVRVLDALAHDQEEIASEQERSGAQVVRADLRDRAARAEALEGAEAVVHLAAIVGDPACASDPKLADEVNVKASTALIEDARKAGVGGFVFASTCSNYGRMADPTVPIAEGGELRPVSLYAEQKVGIETLLLEDPDGLRPTCLRFATVYGVARRMRFDLTVNEFTRDLWADRDLEVFGERFWRPYVHVRDAARAVCTVLGAPVERVAGQVFNVGCSAENYRKLDLIGEIRKQTDRGRVSYVPRAEDPRDYRVSFEKIEAETGFRTRMTVPEGIAELLEALEAGKFDDPFDGRYRNNA